MAFSVFVDHGKGAVTSPVVVQSIVSRLVLVILSALSNGLSLRRHASNDCNIIAPNPGDLLAGSLPAVAGDQLLGSGRDPFRILHVLGLKMATEPILPLCPLG